MIRLEMKNYNTIDEKFLELHTGEEILPSDQSSIIEQVKFTYPLLGKALEKQIKTIEYQRRKLGEIKKT